MPSTACWLMKPAFGRASLVGQSCSVSFRVVADAACRSDLLPQTSRAWGAFCELPSSATNLLATSSLRAQLSAHRDMVEAVVLYPVPTRLTQLLLLVSSFAAVAQSGGRGK